MKNAIILCSLFSCFLIACGNGDRHSAENSKLATPDQDKPMGFPVTNFILGQIKLIEELPVTPLETIDNGEKTDSIWIQREDVRQLAAPFLKPEIDSAFLDKYFSGSSFLDLTINSATFTYLVTPEAPANLTLRQVDVYSDPQTARVKRVYLVKETNEDIVQLTWKTGSWFSIRTIRGDAVRETRVKWNFNE